MLLNYLVANTYVWVIDWLTADLLTDVKLLEKAVRDCKSCFSSLFI
jgi:hypothetical protein